MSYPLSIYGAIATAHSRDVHLTESGFRSYVSRGNIPSPTLRHERQPFWAPKDITEWAQPVDRRRQPEPAPPEPLNLRASNLLDPAPVEDPQLAHAALLQLPERIVELEAVANAHHERAAQAIEASEPPTLGQLTPLELSRWWNESRRARAQRELSDTHFTREVEAWAELEAAREDLARAGAWLERTRAWLAWAARDLELRDEHTAFDRWLATVSDELRPTVFTPIRDWVLEDASRVAWIHRGPHHSAAAMGSWDALSLPERREYPIEHIVLGGGDFGYRWTVPGLPGACRLSWIEDTGELYFVQATQITHPAVAPIAVLPAGSSFHAVMDWLRPFEQIAAHSSAYGLLALEIGLQQSTAWRSLSYLDTPNA